MPALTISSRVAMPAPRSGSCNDLSQRFALADVRVLVRRIGPHACRRDGAARRDVRIEDVKEDEERCVAMLIDPVPQPVDELARGLARAAAVDDRVLVQLLEALMQVRELPVNSTDENESVA